MITFDTNNQGMLTFYQDHHDDHVTVYRYNANGECKRAEKIKNSDFVMLWNLYCYIKDYDIYDGFINPNGKRFRDDM